MNSLTIFAFSAKACTLQDCAALMLRSPPPPRSESPSARSITGHPAIRRFKRDTAAFQGKASRSGSGDSSLASCANFEASDSTPGLVVKSYYRQLQ